MTHTLTHLKFARSLFLGGSTNRGLEVLEKAIQQIKPRKVKSREIKRINCHHCGYLFKPNNNVYRVHKYCGIGCRQRAATKRRRKS